MSGASAPANGLEAVRALYDGLVADKRFVETAPLHTDFARGEEVAALLRAECRLLDARRFDDWLSFWEDDALFWVPLDPEAHPGEDQSLLLDDRRRLGERVWRMNDKTAWGIWPPPKITRVLGGVETWTAPGADHEVLVASSLIIHYVRREHAWQTAGHQIHRLRNSGRGWRLCRKILVLPLIQTGVPNLGWLL